VSWLLGVAAAALAATVPPGSPGARADRPTLSGPELTIDSEDGFFRVHYTAEGFDRPATDDAAERTLAALVEARQRYLDEGYRALVPDDGGGGGDAIDVYIQTVDINGYAHGVVIDGEVGRGSCWMEVDGGLAQLGLLLESVVHHELHHCVEYRYTWEAHSWMYEATATYEQYLGPMDGALSLAVAVLYATRLGSPELAIDDLTGRYEYAGFVFVKFWEDFAGEQDGDRLAIWEALAEDPEWFDALDGEVSAQWGMGFDDLFLEYTTWNGFACIRDDGQHYSEDALACLGQVTVPVGTVAADGSDFEVTHLVTTHTASYLEFPAEGDSRPVALSCDGPGTDAVAGVRLVALDREGVRGEEATTWAGDDEGLTLRLDEEIDSGGGVLAAFVSTGAEPIDLVCSATRVDPVEEPEDPTVCGCSTGRGAAGAWGLLAMGLALSRRRSKNRPVGRKHPT
jgi:MYXO-CTERM domain-containing protein